MKARARTPPLAVLAGLLIWSSPAPARAQTVLYVQSSLTPSCAVIGCSELKFSLDLPSGVGYIKSFTLNTYGAWLFHGLAGVWDMNGNSVLSDFAVSVTNSGVTLTAVDQTAPAPFQPLTIQTSMAQIGAGPDIHKFTYNGEGCFSDACSHQDPPDMAFSGTATPEPVSALLLGTGLAGLAGAARRRRRAPEEAI